MTVFMGCGIGIEEGIGHKAEIIAGAGKGGGIEVIPGIATVYTDKAPVMVGISCGGILYLANIDIGDVQPLEH